MPDHSVNQPPYVPGVSAYGQGNARKTSYDLSGTDEKNHTKIPIVDSLLSPVASIQWDAVGCFTIYDANGTALGDTTVIGTGYPSTCLDPTTHQPTSNAMAMHISFTGKGCMTTNTYENDYVGFELKQTGNKGTGQAKFEGLQGFVPVSALPNGTNAAGQSDPNLSYGRGSALQQAFAGCGPADVKFKPQKAAIRNLVDEQTNLRGEDFPGDAATFSDGTTEFFRSSKPSQNFGFPLSRNQGLSGVLDGTVASDGSRLPNEGFLFISSSAVQTGDIVRAMLPKSTSFTELDYMTYSDPNDFVGPLANPDGPPSIVGNCRIAKWVFGRIQLGAGTNPMFGWFPFRNPAPGGCAPANP